MMTDSIKDILQKEAQAVLNIPITDAFEQAVNMIVEHVHNKGGKLVTIRYG
jgi:arabinose-5-phosphate isomerase